eukprot:11227357-Lingulodinium_polyedra.AAC.1
MLLVSVSGVAMPAGIAGHLGGPCRWTAGHWLGEPVLPTPGLPCGFNGPGRWPGAAIRAGR